jgi:hypothetical protein
VANQKNATALLCLFYHKKISIYLTQQEKYVAGLCAVASCRENHTKENLQGQYIGAEQP